MDPLDNKVHILTLKQQNLKKKNTIISIGNIFLQSILDDYAVDKPVITVCTE